LGFVNITADVGATVGVLVGVAVGATVAMAVVGAAVSVAKAGEMEAAATTGSEGEELAPVLDEPTT
jgi:hypothetical protein